MFLRLFSFALIFMLSSNVMMPEVNVKTINLLFKQGFVYNGAGPLLVMTDEYRNRVIAANTLSSSLTVIDEAKGEVRNIPLGGRVLQHLKSEAMTINKRNGLVYLIGIKKFFIIDPAQDLAETIETDYQYESIAVDENTGNVFLCGRESKDMGFYNVSAKELKMIPWLEHEEELINLNQTPPPPIRKVIAMNDPTRFVCAVDGYTSTIHLFDAMNGGLKKSRDIKLAKEGRWHLAGYNERTHCLFLVTETSKREVKEAARIDVLGDEDIILELPGFREGVGITYNPKLNCVYIPYDNEPSVHEVDFNTEKIFEIKLPAYGNDASAIDIKNDILYIGSWAHGEIEVIDLKTKKLVRVIKNTGIIPHMFAMTFNPNNKKLYFPMGATAVNGCFGASVKKLGPTDGSIEKIHTGWAPLQMIELKGQDKVIVFNNEDQFAVLSPSGESVFNQLTYDHPITACYAPDDNIYLSYGAHQSYWPTVYIWDAKNGVLSIDKETMEFYDRRIPAQAMKMLTDKNGILYLEQNNWGKREQFLSIIPDEVRYPEIKKRMQLADTVTRETTQRIMKYDEAEHLIYLERVAEKDDSPGILQIINPDSSKVIKTIETGLNPADLVFDNNNIYVSNFSSNTVSIISKKDYTVKTVKTSENPLKLCRAAGKTWVINHTGNSLQEIKEGAKQYKLPFDGLPDNIYEWKGRLVISSHNKGELQIIAFDPTKEKFETLHHTGYPYGETSFNTVNSAFYLSGQYGDAIFEICDFLTDSKGRLWVSDFLSGKVFVLF